MCGCLLSTPRLGTWPTTQACAPTGNRTSNPLVRRPVLNPLSHSSQGEIFFYCGVLSELVLVIWTLDNESVFSPIVLFLRGERSKILRDVGINSFKQFW